MRLFTRLYVVQFGERVIEELSVSQTKHDIAGSYHHIRERIRQTDAVLRRSNLIHEIHDRSKPLELARLAIVLLHIAFGLKIQESFRGFHSISQSWEV